MAIPPLSAEELAEMRLETEAAPDISWAVAVSKEFGQRLLATIDAERARADAAEVMYADLLPVAEGAVKRADAQARDYLGAQAAWEAERDKLEGRVGALTEALREIHDSPDSFAEWVVTRATIRRLLAVEPEAKEDDGCPICEGGSGTPCNSHFGV